MNAFLTDCLNLAPIRSKIDVIDIKLKELAQAKEKAQSELLASQAALEATKSAQSSLGSTPTTNVTDTLVDGHKARLNELESTLEALKGAHKLEREAFQVKKPVLDTAPYDRSQIEALEIEIKSLEVQISDELDKERARQVRVNADISAIKLETNNKISVLKLEHGNKIGDAKTTLANLSNMVLPAKTLKKLPFSWPLKSKSLEMVVAIPVSSHGPMKSPKPKNRSYLKNLMNVE